MGKGVIEKITKIERWDNDLGLRIPRDVVDQLRLKAGESVQVQALGNTIMIRRARPRRKWIEKELLKGVTPASCGPDLVPDQTGKELL